MLCFIGERIRGSKMARFRVFGEYNASTGVDADYFEINGHNLMFYSKELGLVAAFYNWESVQRVEDGS
jgi:hypothetical protein